MRFDSIKAKGLGPFREEIAIDLASIEGKLVAVTGENGAGKSTILELLAGALYRSCPTRGPLSSLATARDAFLEVEVVNGAAHRLRHVVDAVSGKGESIVTDGEGRPLVASGKMREFDAWAAKHLPPPEVLYSSTFAAQGSGGFLDLKPGERKGVLLRVLGIERLEALAEKAREHARAAKSDLTVLDARIADEKKRASDPIAVAAELDGLVARRSNLEATLARSRAELDDLIAREQSAREAQRAADEIRRRRADLERRIADARTKRADLERRIGNNEGLLAQRTEIREAQEAAKKLDAQITELQAALADARAEESAAARDRAAARDALADLNARAQRASDRHKRICARLGDKATIDVAVASLPDLRAAVSSAEVVVEAIEDAIKATTDLTISDTTVRLENLRAPLRTIAGGTDAPEEIASKALEDDDRAARDAVEAPKKLETQRRDLEKARADLAARRRELAAAEKTAARAAEIASAEAEIGEAQAEIARLDQEAKAAQAAFEAADARAREKTAALDALLTEREQAQAARTMIDPLLKLVDRLTQAEARIGELSPQASAAGAEIAGLEKELAEVPAAPEPIAIPDIAGARQSVETIDRELRGTEAAIAVKETQLSDARASEGRMRGLESERRKADEELSDWLRLSEDLGRDGVQALEIDAAGPELTALVNDLLRSCVGPRWTVTIEASRLSSDGKKQLEGCEVRVLDTERGREGTAESLSGGERVLVGEAVSLALSMLACRRSGVQGPTLVRDESGAALDPANARAYLQMLRRAAEIVNASHVLFVSHNAEIAEMADARIEVRGGKVRVAA